MENSEITQWISRPYCGYDNNLLNVCPSVDVYSLSKFYRQYCFVVVVKRDVLYTVLYVQKYKFTRDHEAFLIGVLKLCQHFCCAMKHGGKIFGISMVGLGACSPRKK